MPRERLIPLKETVRYQFSGMPRRDTKTEMALRREVHHKGLGFSVALKGPPGTPDLAFTPARVAVFVDGCFWHGCPEHYVASEKNGEWRASKLVENRERDRRADEGLVTEGWLPLDVWEHEGTYEAADVIEQAWQARAGS